MKTARPGTVDRYQPARAAPLAQSPEQGMRAERRDLLSSSSSLARPKISDRPPPKRRKTLRACKYCRDHKLRCDFEGGFVDDDGKSTCKHCADYGLDCVVDASGSKTKTAALESRDGTPNGSSSAASSAARTSYSGDSRILNDPRLCGESPLSRFMGVFLVADPEDAEERTQGALHKWVHGTEMQPTGIDSFLYMPGERRPEEPADESALVKVKLSKQAVRQLLDRFLAYVLPYAAVVTEQEARSAVQMKGNEVAVADLSQLATTILCLSALYRQTPTFIRKALLHRVRNGPWNMLRTSLETVQSILLLSYTIDIWSENTSDSAGMTLNHLAVAVRMAQDLGLHRNVRRLGVASHRVRSMARIWSVCVIQDTWHSSSYGQPYLIDLDDCDALLPSPYSDAVDPETMSATELAQQEQPYALHASLYGLVLLYRRLYRLAFGPRSMRYPPSYRDIRQLRNDAESWVAALPERYTVRDGPRSGYRRPLDAKAGWLFLLKVAFDSLLFRTALSLPASVPRIFMAGAAPELAKDANFALEWVDTPEGLHCCDIFPIAFSTMLQISIIVLHHAGRNYNLRGMLVAARALKRHTDLEEDDSKPAEKGVSPHRRGLQDAADWSQMQGTLSVTGTKYARLVSLLYQVASEHLTQKDDANHHAALPPIARHAARLDRSKPPNDHAVPTFAPSPARSANYLRDRIPSASVPSSTNGGINSIKTSSSSSNSSNNNNNFLPVPAQSGRFHRSSSQLFPPTHHTAGYHPHSGTGPAPPVLQAATSPISSDYCAPSARRVQEPFSRPVGPPPSIRSPSSSVRYRRSEPGMGPYLPYNEPRPLPPPLMPHHSSLGSGELGSLDDSPSAFASIIGGQAALQQPVDSFEGMDLLAIQRWADSLLTGNTS